MRECCPAGHCPGGSVRSPVLETKKDSAAFYHYAYDPDGRRLYEERNGRIYEQIWYAYGINNSLANETVYQGGNLRQEVYYDDSGNITDRVESMRRYGGKEELTYYTYENTYDKAGRLTKQQKSIEGDFYGDYRDTLTQYRYNNKGNVIARTEAFLNGKKWETYNTEAWTYDRYGNLLKYSLNGNVEEEYTYVPLSQAQWS